MNADLSVIVATILVAAGLVIWRRRRGPHVSPTPALSPLGQQVRAGFSYVDEWQDLERTVALLQSSFPPDIFSQAPVLYPPLSDGNQLPYLKELVRMTAARYGLTLHKLHVRFTAKLDTNVCGQIHQQGASMYIDFSERYREDDTALTAIVAHELAHLALWTRNLGRTEERDDEKLTDAFAALAGYGPVMLSSGYQDLGSWKDQHTYVGQVFSKGYLHPRALAYLTLRQAELASVPDLCAFAQSCGPWTQDAYAFVAYQSSRRGQTPSNPRL